MIKLEKFKALKEATAIKKASVIVASKIYNKESVLDEYSMGMYKIIGELPSVDKELLESLIARVEGGENPILIAEYFKALSGLGDVNWDYIKKGTKERRVVNNFNLILDNLRSPYNVGAIFRSAESFGVKMIYLLDDTASPAHPRAVRTSCGTVDVVDHKRLSFEEMKEIIKNDQEASVFSLECGGVELEEFEFPKNGYCFIGNEEFGVRKEALALSNKIATIDTGGYKGSINVSVASGILLYKWYKAVGSII